MRARIYALATPLSRSRTVGGGESEGVHPPAVSTEILLLLKEIRLRVTGLILTLNPIIFFYGLASLAAAPWRG